MKIYRFVGNGQGVPGLPHVIKQSDGDRQMKEAEKAENPHGMPGAILKGALANGNYIAVSTTKEKKSFGKSPEEKESK